MILKTGLKLLKTFELPENLFLKLINFFSIMKKIIFLSAAISITLLITSYKIISNKINADVLSVLGFSKDFANDNILYCVRTGIGGIAHPPNMTLISAMSSSDKTGVAKEFCNYIKSYVYSQEFKDKYEAYRQSQKPSVPQLSEEEKASALEMIAAQEEIFSPENLELLPPEARANALQSIEDMKTSANGELTPAEKADWEAKVPVDPYLKIRSGLKTFLDETKDVDYNATTKLNQYNKKIFTNPAYEEKPGLWKACYRVGKDVSEVGRNFAKEWLAELN